jgi:transposase
LDRLYGPKPGQPAKPVVLVEDNGPIHTSKLSLAALAARAHWLTVEWLPKYAPELNDIEVVWRDLKAHHLAHHTFADPDALDQANPPGRGRAEYRAYRASVGQNHESLP